MEHDPNTPQSLVDEYNKRINDEVARLEAYRTSLQQEYEQRVIDEKDTRYRAMRNFSDSIHDVSKRIIEIALTTNTDEVSALTSLKASQYIYDRVIGNSDAPEKDDMELMLEKLKAPLNTSEIPESLS